MKAPSAVILELDNRLQPNHPQGLTLRSYCLLGFVSRAENPTMTEIALAMRHTTAAATGIVERLVDRGLLKRFPGSDRRTIHIQLTQKGRQAFAKADAVALQIFHDNHAVSV